MPVALAVGSVAAGLYGAKKQSDSAKKGMQAQTAENAANRDYIERQTAEARGDIDKIYPQAQQYRQGGYQGALQALQGALPEQARMLNQGTTAAHSQFLAGMPQFQNAILGAPVDYSAFQQPQQMTPDFSWLQGAKLPELPQAPAGPPMGVIDQRQIQQALSGMNLGGFGEFDKFNNPQTPFGYPNGFFN